MYLREKLKRNALLSHTLFREQEWFSVCIVQYCCPHVFCEWRRWYPKNRLKAQTVGVWVPFDCKKGQWVFITWVLTSNYSWLFQRDKPQPIDTSQISKIRNSSSVEFVKWLQIQNYLIIAPLGRTLIECVHITSRRPCFRSKQRNGGHLELYSWTLFLCNSFLLFHYANMASGHMSEHTLLHNNKENLHMMWNQLQEWLDLINGKCPRFCPV